MESRFLCICFDDRSNKYIEESKVANMTVREMFQQNVLDNDLRLLICTPSFMISMSKNEVPLKKYPQLIFTQRRTKYQRPDYYLYLSKDFPSDFVKIFFTVKHNTTFMVPKIPLVFDILELNNLRVKDVLDDISKLLVGDATVKKLQFNGIDLDENEIIGNYINFDVDGNELFVVIEFNENGIKKLQKRTNILHEIKITEQQFLDDIFQIVSFWEFNIKVKNLMNDLERDFIFRDFDIIQKNHNNFLSAFCEAERNNFSTNAGQLFLENKQILKALIDYIHKYPSINELFEIKKANKGFNAALMELQQENDGRDILSYLITPVQRLPRYLLFLNELIKVTPYFHPDLFFLQKAINVIEKANKKADTYIERAKQRTVLKKIEDKMKKYNIRLAESYRRIEMLVDISLSDQKNLSKAQLCLCNDLVFIYKDKGKTAKLIYSKSISTFHYLPIIGEFRSILIPYIADNKGKYERKELTVMFTKSEEKTQFLDNIKHLLDDIRIKKNHKPRLIVWTLNSISDSLPSICQHNCISNGKSLIFYGGISSFQRIACSDFSTYNQKYFCNYPLSEITTIESGLFGRRKSTFTYLNEHFYVIGGLIGSKEVPEIMKYDLRSKQWHQFNIKFLINCSGHTCVAYQNKLYVYSGKSKEEGLIPDIYVLDPLLETVEKLEISGLKPEPRVGHSAVVKDGKMYIFGGKGKRGLLSDLWSFDFQKKEWTRKQLSRQLNPRKGHMAFVIGNEMVIIGGLSDYLETLSFSIDLDSFVLSEIEDFGNFPQSLRYASGAVLDNNDIIIYGGMEFKSKNPLSTLYTLSLSKEWISYITRKKQPIEPNSQVSQSLWNNILNLSRCHTIIAHRSTYIPIQEQKNSRKYKIFEKNEEKNQERTSLTSLIRPSTSYFLLSDVNSKKLSEEISIEKISSDDDVSFTYLNLIKERKQKQTSTHFMNNFVIAGETTSSRFINKRSNSLMPSHCYTISRRNHGYNEKGKRKITFDQSSFEYGQEEETEMKDDSINVSKEAIKSKNRTNSLKKRNNY